MLFRKLDWAAPAFALFVVLVTLRDVLFEVYLKEDVQSFALFVCATIFFLSLSLVIVDGKLLSLAHKLRDGRALASVLIFGALTGAVYAAGFFVVSKMGAGLAQLVEYGFTPLATAAVGWALFGQRVSAGFCLAAVVYFAGVVFLMHDRGFDGFRYLVLALMLPVVCASMDGLAKWCLSPTGGGLTRSEVLTLRFLPATLVLAGITYVRGTELVIHDVPRSLLVAVVCGFIPLWFLCTGLARSSMQRLASWQFIGPVVAFLGTLPWHPENADALAMVGACLIISGALVGKVLTDELLGRFRRRLAST